MDIAEVTLKVSFEDGEWVVFVVSFGGNLSPSLGDQRSSNGATAAHWNHAADCLNRQGKLLTVRKTSGALPDGTTFYLFE